MKYELWTVDNININMLDTILVYYCYDRLTYYKKYQYVYHIKFDIII